MKTQPVKRAVVGIVAHVDAGKTTLNEALLFRAGAVRTLGSVDGKDSHLDYHALEQQRGITIYAKQTTIERFGIELVMLDTPGHVDFCSEVERVAQVLDYAVLVINGNEGVQGHTLTLWSLLERYKIPTIVFANKMDFAHATREGLIADFNRQLSGSCIDFGGFTARADDDGQIAVDLSPSLTEACASADEGALEEYFETDGLRMETVRNLVMKRAIYPCFFGSALKQEGVDELVDGLAALATEREWPGDFSARVFKVSHDPSGSRLSWIKVTGGTLGPRQIVEGRDARGTWTQKADQVRVYTGAKFKPAALVEAGQICAITGLTRTHAGTTIGALEQRADPLEAQKALFAPAFANSVRPIGADVTQLHAALNTLTDEDPLLNVRFDERLQELQVQLMGEIQLEVLEATLLERFGLEVEFGPSGVLYRETITAPSTGVGHFEPLRHYAEVHMLLEPLPPGSGVKFGTCCHVDELDLNWQRLILTNAMEREHVGVLIGAPITDMRITLIAGRAHAKHTEGGDFRQATYRAIRQGLMNAENVLLEPWHRFSLRVPTEYVGRALSDLQRMSARIEAPRDDGGYSLICGAVPAKEASGYSVKLASYTHGMGSLSLQFEGYEPCHDAEAVIAEAAYDPEADLQNTPDSVFCSHGAGHTVKWDEVAKHAQAAPNPSTYTAWREATPEFFGS